METEFEKENTIVKNTIIIFQYKLLKLKEKEFQEAIERLESYNKQSKLKIEKEL